MRYNSETVKEGDSKIAKMLSKAEALPKAICVKRKREIKTYRQKEDLVIPKFLQSHPQNRLPKDNYEQKDKLIIREIFK